MEQMLFGFHAGQKGIRRMNRELVRRNRFLLRVVLGTLVTLPSHKRSTKVIGRSRAPNVGKYLNRAFCFLSTREPTKGQSHTSAQTVGKSLAKGLTLINIGEATRKRNSLNATPVGKLSIGARTSHHTKESMLGSDRTNVVIVGRAFSGLLIFGGTRRSTREKSCISAWTVGKASF